MTSNICYPIEGINIDAQKLLDELQVVEGEGWVKQDFYSEGSEDWKGIALYSPSGKTDDLRTCREPTVSRTPAGEKCNYICEQLLPQFRAPVMRVLFYRLSAGKVIGRHKDFGQNRTMGMVRIHIPVITNPGVVMHLDDQPYHFGTGEAWYFDASCWHSVENRGKEDRIHLIADFQPSEGLESLIRPISSADRQRYSKHRREYYSHTAKSMLRSLASSDGRRDVINRLSRRLSK